VLTNVVSETNFTMDGNRAAEQLAISNRQWAKQLAISNRQSSERSSQEISEIEISCFDLKKRFQSTIRNLQVRNQIALVVQTYTGKTQHVNQQFSDFGMVNHPLTM